jgi:hypothetical protein
MLRRLFIIPRFQRVRCQLRWLVDPESSDTEEEIQYRLFSDKNFFARFIAHRKHFHNIRDV